MPGARGRLETALPLGRDVEGAHLIAESVLVLAPLLNHLLLLALGELRRVVSLSSFPLLHFIDHLVEFVGATVTLRLNPENLADDLAALPLLVVERFGCPRLLGTAEKPREEEAPND